MEYKLDYIAIGARIRNIRLKMKLTQENLSENVGIVVQHLSKIENGRAPLSLTCLVAIANALQTTTDYLLMENITASNTKLNLKRRHQARNDRAPRAFLAQYDDYFK